MAVARRLVGEAAGVDETKAALAAFGAVLVGARPVQETLVYPCNIKTVLIFVGLSTQWRVGMNGATGLDYPAIPMVAKTLGIKLNPKRIRDLQTMERAALNYWSEQRSNG